MNIIKSTGTFSFYTLISRISGNFRDNLIAIYRKIFDESWSPYNEDKAKVEPDYKKIYNNIAY